MGDESAAHALGLWLALALVVVVILVVAGLALGRNRRLRQDASLMREVRARYGPHDGADA